MTITATQYLFKASIITSTTTATVGNYTVPASTRGQIVTLTAANSAASNVTTYCDVSMYDGAAPAHPVLVKAPLYPGGCLVVEGLAKHVLPTGGAVYVTAYATTGVSVVMSLVELT